MEGMSSKPGSVGAPEQRGPAVSRRTSLLGRLSNLLLKLGAGAAPPAKLEHSHEVARAALRQRMTPPQSDPEEPPLAVRLRHSRRENAPAPARAVFEAQAKALEDFPWPGEGADPEWKPVLISAEQTHGAEPMLDDLAEEAGTDPAAPRVPTGA